MTFTFLTVRHPETRKILIYLLVLCRLATVVSPKSVDGQAIDW
jgi:hypothetical protein